MSMLRTSLMCRRCVADVIVFGTFWTLVYLAESPTVVRCSALFGDISAMVHGDETSRENFNAYWNFSRCTDVLAKIGDYSRMLLIIRRATGAWWCCPDDAQMCASRQHREAGKAPCRDSSIKLGFLTCRIRHALCIMRYAVRYAVCVIPLIQNAAIFSFFFCWAFLKITNQPINQPASQPSNQPTNQPSSQPAKQPNNQPTNQPNNQTTSQPSN